jgi:hypothetical protein
MQTDAEARQEHAPYRDRLSDAAGQLVSAQKRGKPLAPATLQRYETQLEALSQERTGMRELVEVVDALAGPVRQPPGGHQPAEANAGQQQRRWLGNTYRFL